MKKLFYVYDSVEEVNVGYFECQSLDILLRNNAKIFAKMSPHYVEDWSFFCLGNAPRLDKNGLLFDFDTGCLQPIDIKSSVNVECQSNPMTPDEVEKLKSEK